MYFDLMAKISGTEKVSGIERAAVTFTGIAVVFLVLLILIIFVGCFGMFFDKSKKNNSASNGGDVSAPAVSKPATETKSTPMSFACEEDEVIAVISAVIAQMSAADGKTYKIKSVKRRNTTAGGRPIWAAEGIRQNTNPF